MQSLMGATSLLITIFMQIRLKYRVAFQLAGLFLLVSVFIFSALNGFVYFTDSRTYTRGIEYAPIVTELTQVYPWGILGLALINAYVVYRVLKADFHYIAKILVVSPYGLLLITNVTKESVVFLGIFVAVFLGQYFRRRSFFSLNTFGLQLSGALLFLPRPIYIAMFFAKNFYLSVLALAGFFFLYWDDNFVSRLENRAGVQHVGRDFFVGLCQAEKAIVTEFTTCWLPVLFGFPIHRDFLSINYLIFIFGYLPFMLLMVQLVLQKKYQYKLVFLSAICLHWYIFYYAPSFGAFFRYFHPVMWFVAFLSFNDSAGLYRSIKFRFQAA